MSTFAPFPSVDAWSDDDASPVGGRISSAVTEGFPEGFGALVLALSSLSCQKTRCSLKSCLSSVESVISLGGCNKSRRNWRFPNLTTLELIKSSWKNQGVQGGTTLVKLVLQILYSEMWEQIYGTCYKYFAIKIGEFAFPYCSCHKSLHWWTNKILQLVSGFSLTWWSSSVLGLRHLAQVIENWGWQMKVATPPEPFTLQTEEWGCLTTSVKLEVFLRRLLPSAFSSWNLAPLAVSELVEAVAVVAAGLTAMLQISIQMH